MLQIKVLGQGGKTEWLVKNRYTFGSGAENQYAVHSPGISDIHAGLEVNGDDVVLFNIAGGDLVQVNDTPLQKSAALKPGDLFRVGEREFEILDPKKNHQPKIKTESLVSWALKANNTALAKKSFPLEATHVLGRSNECDICLNVVHLSRKHAKIEVHDDGLHIEDLESSNGTFVNGRRVKKAIVRAGDEIAFDTLRFQVIGPQTAFDKTFNRDMGENTNVTTVRPALSEEEIRKAATQQGHKAERPKAAGPRRAPPKRPLDSPSTDTKPSSAVQVEPAPRNAVPVMLLALVGIAAAAIAAYVMLG